MSSNHAQSSPRRPLAAPLMQVLRRPFVERILSQPEGRLLVLNADVSWPLAQRLARDFAHRQVYAVTGNGSVPSIEQMAGMCLSNLLPLVAKPSQLPFPASYFDAILVMPSPSATLHDLMDLRGLLRTDDRESVHGGWTRLALSDGEPFVAILARGRPHRGRAGVRPHTLAG